MKNESVAVEFPSLIIAIFEGFLWNTFDEFPHYLPLILRQKSLISSDSQRLTEIVFVVQLQTLHEISHWKKPLGHFQDLGHSFSLYGPPCRPITYNIFLGVVPYFALPYRLVKT